jgi:endogenous inhibitor of DNA gyrase (YacG/DUF329 family)
MAARVRCPTCKREIAWSEEFPHRPFCSDRCRLIDLGAWLSERHAIPNADADLNDETAHGDVSGEN